LKLVAASSPPSPKNAPSSPSPSLERSRGWHIVIVVTYPDTIAGAEVHVRDLAKALYAKGHHLTVFVGGNGPFSEDRKRNEIPYRALPMLVRSTDRTAPAVGETRGMRRLGFFALAFLIIWTGVERGSYAARSRSGTIEFCAP